MLSMDLEGAAQDNQFYTVSFEINLPFKKCFVSQKQFFIDK